MLTYLAVGIFIIAFGFIILELFDKSLVALTGALLVVILGILTPEEAIQAVQFETILLLIAMMLLVSMASKSGIFAWLNVKIVSLTRGNPLAIFLFFSILTGVMSAFLDNVTTVILIVPLTIELIKGMGKDPKPYIFAEILFSNIGGTLTLIGDPSNIMIGGASGFNFLDFIVNQWIPVLSVSIFTILVFIIRYWKKLKPISDNLLELCIANVIIKKIKYKFVKKTINKNFVIKVVSILFLTILGFFLQSLIGLPTYVIAFAFAILLGIMTSKKVDIHESLKSVEWTTLFFFCGLFIMVAAVEKSGALDLLSGWIASSTTNILYLSLLILWATGVFSMVIDNIPFVTVMLPVIAGIQANVPGDTGVLWWALSLGACLGGCGTAVGASANVVSIGLAKKEDVHISFIDYFKANFPVTVGLLCVCSIYLFFRLG